MTARGHNAQLAQQYTSTRQGIDAFPQHGWDLGIWRMADSFKRSRKSQVLPFAWATRVGDGRVSGLWQVLLMRREAFEGIRHMPLPLVSPAASAPRGGMDGGR